MSDYIDRIQDPKFREELQSLLNRFSIDDALDMPDYVLSSWIVADLVNVLTFHECRLDWQGRERWTP